MKKLYTIIFQILVFLFIASMPLEKAYAAKCNWKNLKAGYYFWDSCNTSKSGTSVNGYISFSSKSCLKYQWTINSANAGTGYVMHYAITKNGTYNVCVKVTDTCNNCDTNYCSTRTITCIKNSCNFSAGYAFWDSCNATKKRYSLNAYISFSSKSCLKYQWTVNSASAGTGYVMNYPITQNGTYSVCVKVSDTCNNCDTTYCSTRTITCIKNACNWNGQKMGSYFWDSCTGKKNKYSVNAYISFGSKSCLKYQWTVNSVNAGTGYIMNYPITKNGTYSVCVKVSDTCGYCDTTYCSTRTITCVTNTCNWKTRGMYFTAGDSCNTKTNKYALNGYIGPLVGCYKYNWYVNSALVSTSRGLNYSITKNGTYNLCMKVIDTCNNCDTTFCSTRNITCVKGNNCNWASRYPAVGYWDTCTGKKNKYSLNAYIYYTSYYYKSCLKYQWTVNGNNAGTADLMNNYPITTNGNYSICVKVTDTCNNCDTTYCTTRTITCVSSSKCNWKSRSAYAYFWDTCNTSKKRYSLNAYISFSSKSCFKYQWTVNGTNAGNGYVMNYPITANGKYSVCVKVTDTCNNCDTTYCSSRGITCISHCNWVTKGMYFSAWDSCNTKTGKYSLNGYIGPSGGCYKYNWYVNSALVSTSRFFNYSITKNGTYSLCMKVIDTCSNCDTTFCSTRYITCVKSGCNWKGQKPGYYFWDSCTGKHYTYSLNGYISFSNKNCMKYQWTVNGYKAGNGYVMNFPITQNGTYTVCIKVTDTCHSCDTTYCNTRNITCLTSGIKPSDGENRLNIYPNPSEGMVYIENHNGRGLFTLTDVSGQVIQAGVLEIGQQLLDLSKHPGGLYFINLKTSEAIFKQKIIVLKH